MEPETAEDYYIKQQ